MKRSTRIAAVMLGLALLLGGIYQPGTVKGAPLGVTGPSATVIPGAWRNMRPTESYLRDVSMLPAGSVDCSSSRKDNRSQGWIVGDAGVILGYCNGIWDQSITTESIPTSLYGVFAVTRYLAFASGADGAILKYGWDSFAKDYTWVKLPITVSNQGLNSITVIQNGEYNSFPRYSSWAVGTKDTVYNKPTLIRGDIYSDGLTDDLGNPIYYSSWTNVTSSYNLPVMDFYSGVQALSADDIWAVGGKSGQGVAIHWNGTGWTAYTIGNNKFYGVYFRSSSDGWAVGEGGQIYHYNGSAWSSVSSPVTTALRDVSFSTDGTGWITGVNGVLLMYVAGQWVKFTDLRTDYWDFYALDHTSGHGWMVGQNPRKIPAVGKLTNGIGGQILEYSESDQAWVAVTIPTDNRLDSVKTISDTDAWAVGTADANGATIIRWDGKHWQRWFQNDPPLPKVDLRTVDMLSPTNGWAAGDTPSSGAPALMLHWDGRRWAPIRYSAPINVTINDISLSYVTDPTYGIQDFGWVAANDGNAVAKYDYVNGYWSANHIYQGIYFLLRGLSLATNGLPSTPTQVTAWAVGRQTNPAGSEYFLRYQDVGGGTWYWDREQTPPAPGTATDGATNTHLYGIQMVQNPDWSEWGFASGDYSNRATIYKYNGSSWSNYYAKAGNSPNNPSRFISSDIVAETGTGWFGGYYKDTTYNRSVAYMAYVDQNGYGPTSGLTFPIFPINGKNIYHRPVGSLDMSSDTMGWAVGDKQDSGEVGVLYQYPYPNFTLSVDPTVRAVRPGSQADYVVSINSIAAGDMSVNLDLDTANLPAGVTYQISPNPANPSTLATITLNVPVGTAMGKYDFNIIGQSTIHSGDHDIPVTRFAPVTLWVTDHPITDVSPDHGPSGTIVTISGENLGNDPGAGNRNTDTDRVILAGKQMPDDAIISWTSTQIQVRVPDSLAVFPEGPVKDIVQVISGGTESSDNLDFQLENYIAGYNLSNDGQIKTLSIPGTSFGPDPGSNQRSTIYENVTVGGVILDYGNVVSWSNNLIEFQVSSTTLLDGKALTVTSNGYTSNSVTIRDRNLPDGWSLIYLPMVKR